MSKEFIINDAYFGKIKDSFISGEALKHFIEKVVYNNPNCEVLLRHFSDIYVLVAHFSQNGFIKDGKKSWKELMNKDEYDILEKNRYFILAYMLVTEKAQKHYHYIDYIDTIIRTNNFGRVMIFKYEKIFDFEVALVPQEILQSSAGYWAKILDLYYEDDDTGKKTISIECIKEYIKEFQLNSNDLLWKHLYDLCLYPSNSDDTLRIS